MISFSVFLFLVLPFCVEESSVSALSMTIADTKSHESTSINSENNTETGGNGTSPAIFTDSATTDFGDNESTNIVASSSEIPTKSTPTTIEVTSTSATTTESSSSTSQLPEPRNDTLLLSTKLPREEESNSTLPDSSSDTSTYDSTISSETSTSPDTSTSDSTISSETSTFPDTSTSDSTLSSETSTSPDTSTSDLTISSETSTFPDTSTSDSTISSETSTFPDTSTSDLTISSETSTSDSPTSPGVTSSTDISTSSDTSTQDNTESTTTADSTDDNGVNVGLVIGIIIPILLIGVGVVLWRAHRSGRRLWPPKNLFSNGPSDSVRPQLVPLKKFPAHCSEMLDVPSKLSHEYQLLATLSVDIYSTESCVAGQLPDNKYKNRYVNILPYDSTRVKLFPEGEDFYSDYVNASYIKGYTNEIEYIATQGPKEETCKDFWKMVYQEPIKVIIMVTQLEEQGKPKCYKYYPKLRENMELEDIIVRCTTELHFPIYTSRTLILTKGERKRSITHLHFREWPDFGCPATPDLMLQFCQVMRHNIILAQPGITLIHCSAGVGRTGTLIAVDILLQHIKENKKIDIFGTVYKLRKHRMNMVQSEAQYVYIYKCIKEALEDPSYLSSENSSTTSLEPIYENIECARLSTVSDKAMPETIISVNECAL